MAEPPHSGHLILSLARWVAISWLVLGSCASAQNYYTVQEVRISELPFLAATSQDPSDVLLTSLDTIIHDREVCCAKDSALEDSAERSDPASLKDIAARMQGRHLLSDGRPIVVSAEYFEPSAIKTWTLIGNLRDKHALLMEWNSRLYVCYGVTYRNEYDPDAGGEIDTVLKLSLLDTRYSDSRRHLSFDLATDDWRKVQGMLRLIVAPQ
jgi:hypothetical protein